VTIFCWNRHKNQTRKLVFPRIKTLQNKSCTQVQESDYETSFLLELKPWKKESWTQVQVVSRNKMNYFLFLKTLARKFEYYKYFNSFNSLYTAYNTLRGESITLFDSLSVLRTLVCLFLCLCFLPQELWYLQSEGAGCCRRRKHREWLNWSWELDGCMSRGKEIQLVATFVF
jgi:hypothetical protein